jgi:hypothetical protein
VLFITLLAGYFHYYDSWVCALWMMALFGFAFLTYQDAFRNKSFYFLLLVILYSYIAVSSLMLRLFMQIPNGGGISLALMYFIGSGIGIIFLLINLNKKLKAV